MVERADLSVGAPSAPEVDVAAKSAGPSSQRAPRRAPGRDDLRSTGFAAAPDPEGVVAMVDERRVRSMLRSLSGVIGALLGDEDVERHWRFTNDELEELTPPLTRYINRTPRLLLAVDKGDELEIALVLAGWTGRNIVDAKNAREARREREREAEGSEPSGDAGRGALGLVGGAGRQGGGAAPAPDGGGRS